MHRLPDQQLKHCSVGGSQLRTCPYMVIVWRTTELAISDLSKLVSLHYLVKCEIIGHNFIAYARDVNNM